MPGLPGSRWSRRMGAEFQVDHHRERQEYWSGTQLQQVRRPHLLPQWRCQPLDQVSMFLG